MDTKVALFENQRIRRIWHNNEWWFSVIDVVGILSDSNTPKRYWSDLKIKLKKEGYNEVYEKIVQLKLNTPDNKLRLTDCANTETMLRIIQSIPSPKAEPFKRWLSRIGKERVDEILISIMNNNANRITLNNNFLAFNHSNFTLSQIIPEVNIVKSSTFRL